MNDRLSGGKPLKARVRTSFSLPGNFTTMSASLHMVLGDGITEYSLKGCLIKFIWYDRTGAVEMKEWKRKKHSNKSILFTMSKADQYSVHIYNSHT